MTVLVLPPRYIDDSIALSRTAFRAGLEIERLPSWHIPPLLKEEGACPYGEPLFAIHASGHLGLRRDNATDQWLADDNDTAAATEFLSRVLRDPGASIPPAAVIDVGRIREHGWALVEANPARGSGIYGCDPDAVLKVVRRSCVKQEQLAERDRPWVIDHLSEDFT